MFTQNAKIAQLALHYIGSKSDDAGTKLSKSLLKIDEDLKALLLGFFLKSFKTHEKFTFTHSSDLELNEVYTFASKIFADSDALFLQSVSIAQHLYEQSAHPNIKSGELYVVYFRDIMLDNEEVDAVGIFKSENRDTFLRVFPTEGGFEIESENGININKLDKGCLIFDTEKEKGFKVCVIDNTNKGDEARYWKNDFLNIKTREDNFQYTQNYLELCKDFVKDQLPTEFEVSKPEQIDMLNRSVNFFKKKENFDVNTFSEEVLQQPEIIDSFKTFKKSYQSEHEMPLVDEFEISEQAVKNKAKIFKSILKLDKNFHIYIHGNKDLIEKGVDEEKKMKFYKIYYREES